MLVLSTVFSAILCLFLSSKAEVTVEKNVYKNVGVSFDSNVVSFYRKEELLKSIQDLLRNTSRSIYTATGYQIGSVSIHLPSSWDTSDWEDIAPITFVEDDPEPGDIVVVDTLDASVFGDSPHTRQYGGCGSRGLPIRIPLKFLKTTLEVGYSKEKLLAREWIKYRYGVFDENGFNEDPIYPAFYKVLGSTYDMRITECTHPRVDYNFYKKDGEICTKADLEYNHDCWPLPKHENTTGIKSSLMFLYEALPHLEEVCGRHGNHHNANSDNKHNTLCNGKSVWDVITESPDNATYEEVEWIDEDIQFTFQQKAKPRFIVAVEKTDVLNGQAEQIVFALRRLLFDAWNQSKSGVYTFDAEVQLVKTLGEGYSDLSIPEEFHGLSAQVCISCALKKAVEDLLEDNAEGKGTILLVTGSPYANTNPDLVEALENSKLCVSVIVFADDDESAKLLMDSYKPITSDPNCPSHVSVVMKEQDSGASFQNLISLMRSYLAFQPFENIIQEMVQASVMSVENNVTFPVTSDVGFYGLWLSKNTDAGLLSCNKSNGNVIIMNKVNTYAFASTAVSYFIILPGDTDKVVCSYRSSASHRFAEVAAYTGYEKKVAADLWIEKSSAEDKSQGPVRIYFSLDNLNNNPIQDAKITAKIANREDEIQLFDDGRDPDITQHDGVYSGYFMDFAKGHEYTLIVKATDNGGQAKIGKYGHGCCSSFVKAGLQSNAPSFELERSTTFTVDYDPPEGGFPPSRVIDLKIELWIPTIILSWTAPGGGKAKSYSIKTFSSRMEAIENFDNKGTIFNITFKPANQGASESIELDVTHLQNNATYFVAMTTLNEQDKVSQTSNVVEFFLPVYEQKTTTQTTETTTYIKTKTSDTAKRTTIIVISVLASIIVVCIAVYVVFFYLCRRKNSKAQGSEAGRNGQTQQKNTPTIPLSGPQFNSIPAEVILKHHNEVVEAKNLHKDPPVFTEESLNSTSLPEVTNKNNIPTQYAIVDRRQPDQTPSTTQDPSKSPKRMTVV